MGIKLQVFTLNCGNASPGEVASREIVQRFLDSGAHLFILNCQEVHRLKTLQMFLAICREKQGLSVKASSNLVTHTKFKTQFHHQTGLTTFILHKTDLKVLTKSKQIRRNPLRWYQGYNKGGLLTRLHITIDNKTYTVDTLNAHLDAFGEALRAKDWANLHRIQKHTVNNWEELTTAIPHLLCSGYDANTRNKLHRQEASLLEHSENAWEQFYEPEMQPLVFAHLGNYRESQFSTYKSHLPHILVTADKKRPNYAKGGMLDIVAHSNVAYAKEQLQSRALGAVHASGYYLAPEAGYARDHAVIGSHLITLEDDIETFDRIRYAIAIALSDVAPALTGYLFSDAVYDIPQHRDYLLLVYQLYLSPTGLLQKRLDLQAQQLKILEQQSQKSIIFKRQLFLGPIPWFITHEHKKFETIEGLQAIADTHYYTYMLMNLKAQLLHEAQSDNECQDIVSIFTNALSYSSQENFHHMSALEEVKKIFAVVQVAHRYQQHLLIAERNKLSEVSLQLLKTKQGIINDLLAYTKQPGETASTIIQNIDDLITTHEATLSEFRNDAWFMQLFFMLKAIILGKPSKAHGGQFTLDVKNILEEDEIPALFAASA